MTEHHISELPAPCPCCGGDGKYFTHGWEWEQYEHRCEGCDGTGEVRTEQVTLEDIDNMGDQKCGACDGSGFSGRGSGYGDVCPECGGQSRLTEPELLPEAAEAIRIAEQYLAGQSLEHQKALALDIMQAIHRFGTIIAMDAIRTANNQAKPH